MLTEEKISELKEKYGKVYAVHLAGIDFVYKPLMREEYMKFQQEAFTELQAKGELDPNMESEYEAKMVEHCVVFPENFSLKENKEAGLQSSLAAYIYESSGFSTQAQPIEL